MTKEQIMEIFPSEYIWSNDFIAKGFTKTQWNGVRSALLRVAELEEKNHQWREFACNLIEELEAESGGEATWAHERFLELTKE